MINKKVEEEIKWGGNWRVEEGRRKLS